jgi:hypothetical protein
MFGPWAKNLQGATGAAADSLSQFSTWFGVAEGGGAAAATTDDDAVAGWGASALVSVSRVLLLLSLTDLAETARGAEGRASAAVEARGGDATEAAAAPEADADADDDDGGGSGDASGAV